MDSGALSCAFLAKKNYFFEVGKIYKIVHGGMVRSDKNKGHSDGRSQHEYVGVDADFGTKTGKPCLKNVDIYFFQAGIEWLLLMFLLSSFPTMTTWYCKGVTSNQKWSQLKMVSAFQISFNQLLQTLLLY